MERCQKMFVSRSRRLALTSGPTVEDRPRNCSVLVAQFAAQQKLVYPEVMQEFSGTICFSIHPLPREFIPLA